MLYAMVDCKTLSAQINSWFRERDDFIHHMFVDCEIIRQQNQLVQDLARYAENQKWTISCFKTSNL